MENLNFENSAPEPVSDFDARYRRALDYFKSRSPVIFVSQHYHFWEQHGFVQQSLAKELVLGGVAVEWYDGAHWRSPKIFKTWDSSLLNVSQLPCLPFRRIGIVEKLNPKIQSAFLKKRIRKGTQPFLWIQSGLDERVVEQLPYIDAFSVFDDPYIHSPQGLLSERANLILTQNDFAQKLFQREHGRKVRCMFPPVEMNPECFDDKTNYEFPDSFPTKIMGYVGSFFSEGFDLVLFEHFIKSLPDWGFVLCGRTDERGLNKVQSWKKYKNFIYIPWVPRTQVGAVWRKINLNLMLYRPVSTSDGAFPVKFLEALYFRVPSVTTVVPKTSSLEGVIPRLLFPDHLLKESLKAASENSQQLEKLYRQFSREMCPKTQLIQVAESCQAHV